MLVGARETLLERVGRMAAVLRRIIGAPDYDSYVAHVTTCGCGTAPMSKEEFARDALARRYNRPGSRCC